jgi:hypothetical protein
VLIAALAIAACSSPPGADRLAADDPLSGMWSGDWGPDATRRDPVSLELRWDGNDLEGTVNPGRNGLEITKASFDRTTGAIALEFEAYDDGRAVHFAIEGKVDGKTMAGTWSRHDRKGDFRLTRD